MQVAICDDEKIFRDKLKEVLIEYKTSKRIHMDIFEYSSGTALLSDDKAFDMVFMDYQMPEIDGLETARMLRAKNSICSIIFITAYPQFILDSFEVQPFRFMIKPLDVDKITGAIDSFLHQQKLISPLIVIEDGEQKTVRAQDIIYIEGDGKYCWVRTATGLLHSSKTVSQVFDILPTHCFFRIHKSYIINMYCVESVKENTVMLNNGEKATIGRNHITEFKQAYMNFVKNFYVRF